MESLAKAEIRRNFTMSSYDWYKERMLYQQKNKKYSENLTIQKKIRKSLFISAAAYIFD